MLTGVISNKIRLSLGLLDDSLPHGLSDAGVAATQMLDRQTTLCRTTNAAVIADADTGYGGLPNVHHTDHGYDEAGVVGMQIGDQEFSKMRGHTPFKGVVSTLDMVEKVKVAVEVPAVMKPSSSPAPMPARRWVRGRAQAGIAYGDAGADVIFLEALDGEAEMREACTQIKKPMMANMADGGLTPTRLAAELEKIVYKMAIYPARTGLAAAARLRTR